MAFAQGLAWPFGPVLEPVLGQQVAAVQLGRRPVVLRIPGLVGSPARGFEGVGVQPRHGAVRQQHHVVAQRAQGFRTSRRAPGGRRTAPDAGCWWPTPHRGRATAQPPGRPGAADGRGRAPTASPASWPCVSARRQRPPADQPRSPRIHRGGGSARLRRQPLSRAARRRQPPTRRRYPHPWTPASDPERSGGACRGPLPLTTPTLTFVVVTLREITDGNREAVLALHVAPEQAAVRTGSVQGAPPRRRRVAGTPSRWYRAIYADDQPVGFVMVSWDVEPQPPEILGPWFLPGSCSSTSDTRAVATAPRPCGRLARLVRAEEGERAARRATSPRTLRGPAGVLQADRVCADRRARRRQAR